MYDIRKCLTTFQGASILPKRDRHKTQTYVIGHVVITAVKTVRGAREQRMEVLARSYKVVFPRRPL